MSLCQIPLQNPSALATPTQKQKILIPNIVNHAECQTNLNGEEFMREYGYGKGFTCISQKSTAFRPSHNLNPGCSSV